MPSILPGLAQRRADTNIGALHAGLTVESTPGHYRVLRDGKPLRKANGMPFMLPFSPDTIRWRRAAIVDLRKLGIDV
jgi:hypothetical protein